MDKNNESSGKRWVESLDYYKGTSQIDEALNAEGTCACSAIRCTKGCSIAEGNGVTVAVNFSRAVPSVASTPEGETMPEGG